MNKIVSMSRCICLLSSQATISLYKMVGFACMRLVVHSFDMNMLLYNYIFYILLILDNLACALMFLMKVCYPYINKFVNFKCDSCLFTILLFQSYNFIFKLNKMCVFPKQSLLSHASKYEEFNFVAIYRHRKSPQRKSL